MILIASPSSNQCILLFNYAKKRLKEERKQFIAFDYTDLLSSNYVRDLMIMLIK